MKLNLEIESTENGFILISRPVNSNTRKFVFYRTEELLTHILKEIEESTPKTRVPKAPTPAPHPSIPEEEE